MLACKPEAAGKITTCKSKTVKNQPVIWEKNHPVFAFVMRKTNKFIILNLEIDANFFQMSIISIMSCIGALKVFCRYENNYDKYIVLKLII